MKKDVLVLTPVYKKALDAYELVSIRSIVDKLKDRDKMVMAPEKFRGDEEFDALWKGFGYSITYFEDRHFNGIEAHNRFMLSAEFYDKFTDYEYLLLCQPDVLILSDQIDEWVSKGYDYVGAPWVYEDKEGIRFNNAGNGGFSLRRTRAFLDVIGSDQLFYKPFTTTFLDHQFYNPYPFVMRTLLKFKGLKRYAHLFKGVYWANEDRFWTCYATFFRNEFKVADAKTSLAFGFERYPRFCYEQNEQDLPFGAHAWQEYDIDFWFQHVPGLVQTLSNKPKAP